ncbi:Thiol-disulfide oxidoreductase ResA [bioreactor metagenome]|uniref:Thiol-disulfide oxidoreductase ResA n=1 Tax=bioreactor metagenome TaxID=1076179 RepID=A0A644WKB8_9ZZZZ|nr:thioredoxin family protein [Paludibacter sp.]
MKTKSKLTLLTLLSVLSLSLYAQGYKPGDTATDFRLKNVDERMVSLADYKDANGFIVVFTCNECPYAKAYESRLIALDQKYKAKGYPVIAINSNDPAVSTSDSFEAMQKKHAEKKYTFPYLVDAGQQIFPQYGATKTPHVFILQKEKKQLVVKYIGAIDNNYKDANDVSEKYVEDAIEALLNKKPVKKAVTVAVGCGIKVKK